MNIGLIQVDGKLPNLALMKISSYYKAMGVNVEFVKPKGTYDKIYASVLFTWNREIAIRLQHQYKNIEIGGTGYDLKITLPPDIEKCRPDYELYSPAMIENMIRGGIRKKETTFKKALEIATMGTGFTSRGCVRQCKFCVVNQKEGKLRQESSIADIVNPKSKLITLYDNNLTADPECINKLREIRDRKLIVDISQGVDIRYMTDEIAKALSEVKHMRSLHYAWDLMQYEKEILSGIKVLSKIIKPWSHMCFVLVGYNTTHEEDMYRVHKLNELGVTPYIMRYNNRKENARLNHFTRWINGHFYKTCSFEDYIPWKKHQAMDDLFRDCI